MVKKINPLLAGKRISDKGRHIRWNVERSPEQMIMDSGSNRYHFVIVDDRDREHTAIKIAEYLSEAGPVMTIREGIEGKVQGTRLRYLFISYDSPASQEVLNLSRLRKPLKRDLDLRERIKKGLSVEDYVAKIYEG